MAETLVEDATTIDDWCKRRAAAITERAAAHIEAGKDLNDPEYRVLLGEHRAYLAVRSFIHGSLATIDSAMGEG